MTRRSLAWLFGPLLAALVLGPTPTWHAPSGAIVRFQVPVASADSGSAALIDDDDDSQPLGSAPVAILAFGPASLLGPPSPNPVLARHRIALDPIPVGIRKLPASPDDPSASY